MRIRIVNRITHIGRTELISKSMKNKRKITDNLRGSKSKKFTGICRGSKKD